jgi:hypothetical protein
MGKAMRIEVEMIFWMQQIHNIVNILICKLGRGSYEPERKTSGEKILRNSYIISENTDGVSHLESRRHTSIHAGLEDLHVIDESPKLQPDPLQVLH